MLMLSLADVSTKYAFILLANSSPSLFLTCLSSIISILLATNVMMMLLLDSVRRSSNHDITFPNDDLFDTSYTTNAPIVPL